MENVSVSGAGTTQILIEVDEKREEYLMKALRRYLHCNLGDSRCRHEKGVSKLSRDRHALQQYEAWCDRAHQYAR